MPKNGMQTDTPECSQVHSAEAIRLIWEGTQKALDESGMDRGDVVSLCDIIVRLADHSVLSIEAKASRPESSQVVGQIRHYRELASHLLQWASAPVPEPDWSKVSEKLRSAGAAAVE